MKITVITATRNNASTLHDTISSVMNQTHNDIDYIIIDGSSSDNSVDIIKQWQLRHPDKIRFISEPDNGVYQAINKGIRMAKGDIIGTLHGNDRFSSPDILNRISNAMQLHTADLIYGDVHFVKPGKNKCVRRYTSDKFRPEMLKIGIAPPHPSLYMRKEIFQQYGLYKEDYLIGADFEMFTRLMLTHSIKGIYLPVDMVTMTTGGLSTQLYHRIVTNNREKYRALRENNIKVNRFSLLKRYLYTLKS